MSVIRKQTIIGSIYLYTGVGLGFIITGVLFPKILSADQIGLLRLLVSYSAIFSQFASLGWPRITARMFPYFRNKKEKHNGFFFLLLIVGLIGFCIAVIIFYLLKPVIISVNIEKSALFLDYINYLIPFILATLFFSLLEAYARVLYYSVEGTFAREVFQRIITLIGILLFFFNYLDFNEFVVFYLISRALPIVFLFLFLLSKKEISIKPQFKTLLDKKFVKTIISVGLYGIIGGFVYNLILNVDSIIVGSMLGTGATGVYSTTFFFGTLIIIPSRALRRTSSIFIADAWKDNDLNKIREIYYKSSINQFLSGLLLLIIIWINIHNILNFLPEEFAKGKYVILFIGLARLADAFSGNSSVIISLSKYYKVSTLFSSISLVLIIVTNLIFIPAWGISGAAFATFITLFITMIIKYLFLKIKYHLKIYDIKHVFIILSGLIAYMINELVPVHENLYLDIIIRSIPVVIVYFMLIYSFKVSEDINDLSNKLISRLLKK